ncbi:MAG: HYR domain-containing protein, partial [Actinomycetota bacterium]|nr:HYR domain-containing protein [Actinomycetota bacterium]
MSVLERTPRARPAALLAAFSLLFAAALPAAPAVAATQTYSSTAAVAFVDGGSAPASVITVGGGDQVINDVDVNLTITHSFLADADILLVGPEGQSVILMSDVGCSTSASGLALKFDQSASASLSPNQGVTAGTYLPTNISGGCDGGADIFPLAPAAPWGSSLDVFNGTNPVGAWRLFLVDDVAVETGQVSSWSLTIDADPVAAPEITSDATVSGVVGDAFSHTFTTTGVPDAELSYSDEDLPPGVTRTGDALSGTPTTPGEYSITATASNGIDPDATQTLEITIDERPAITSAASVVLGAGTPLEHIFTASGSPTPTLTYADENLPEGISLTGNALSGVTTETGDFEVTVTAANGVDPDAVQTFALTVVEGPSAPVITLADGQAETTNTQPIEFTITFDEEPVGFDAEDVLVGTTAGGDTVVALSGGPLEWTASVSGLGGEGIVDVAILAGAWTDADGYWGPDASSPVVTLDLTAPVIAGPAGPVSTTTDPGQPGAVVTFDFTASDAPIWSAPGFVASSGAAVGPAALASHACVPASGSFFAIGTTTVECSATDEAGNSSQLAFDVTVVDHEAPVIDAVEDITLELAEGATTATVDFAWPSATDNSGDVEVACDLEPGAALAEGEHTVTCTAVDPSANTATSGFTVSIVAADAGDDEG